MKSWQAEMAQRVTARLAPDIIRPHFQAYDVDWERLVTIDFETYYADDYTLSKLSTSEYVRDKRFKAQMMYLKVGTKPARVIPPNKIAAELRKINWTTHALLCHHTQFDGLILSHHYGVVPSFYFDTLSMARGLHSNEIGAGLDEVSMYYGGEGKIDGVLETTKNVLDWSPKLFNDVTPYCMRDGDETLRVFTEMVCALPEEEIRLINVIVRMFCDPVLRINRPLVEQELVREIKERDDLLATIIDPKPYYEDKTVLKTKAERALTGRERDLLVSRRIIGSTNKFADLLIAEGVEPPVKVSPAWMKKTKEQREADPDSKWAYAFAKDDIEFQNLPDNQECWDTKYDLNTKRSVALCAAKSERLRALVDARISVKSTTNITRAERLLTASDDGNRLPAYYAYSRAHTHRLGGGDKRNLQNLKRGGKLREAIEAEDGHVLVVGDSGQIECRVNAWLWGQKDLLDIFRAKGDPYCAMATLAYGRTITKADTTERFVGKVLVLGLGFQMGPDKLQMTLAKGALGGPPVYIDSKQAKSWVYLYRGKNPMIEKGWSICHNIILSMATGRKGGCGPIAWEQDKLWLPNGMCLHYPDLRHEVTDKGFAEWTYGSTLNGTPIRKKIYGGLLCENIVQALARIIVMYQLLELSKTYRLVMTTHDEGVLHVKKKDADKAFAAMMKRMTTPLSWCPDIPLSAEGGYATNYSK
jgi:DNA polymerase I-like protein with 3'-5' exonuclease and polymerase domains